MAAPDEPHTPTASEKLAAIVEKRRQAAGHGPGNGPPGQRKAEQAAAARSASKSKPALRKG